ncbi:GNAT family N-acetyltransferase [Sinimarinibacterium thermocellulolyticum]|uniref:GNAT family N-acetyltransferase n=1 Tax=Sinimarinibacterium thermocellulolyticum TaxID=3170016 RepID=A0ABV2A931_9GAMM
MLDLASRAWIDLIESTLSARVYPLDEGFQLTVFRRGPWRIGYLNFVAGCEALQPMSIARLRTIAREMGVHALRVQANEPVSDSLSFARYPLSACRIRDLQRWHVRQFDKGRRTENRLSRTALNLRPAVAGDGAAMHRLYQSTVQRKGGTAHYTRAYFEALAPLAGYVAEKDGVVVGFVCSARYGDRGLYLHGAHADSARSLYASDLLFLRMLEAARAAGLRSFDFLHSPHPSLLRYKQMWGGEAMTDWVSDLALNWRGTAFAALYSLRHRIRGQRSEPVRDKAEAE